MNDSDRSLRRVVTGTDSTGASEVTSDELLVPAPGPADVPRPTFAWRSMETTSQGGILDLPPFAASTMHRTDTLDYIAVLAGAVAIELDATTIVLGAGDVLIQRATRHRWRNPAAEPARLFFVSIAC
jgi:hypothetical protein